MAVLKLTAFTCDRDSGHDTGQASDTCEVDEHAHEALFKEAIGNTVVAVINKMRRQGYDARQYDVNVRLENSHG